MRYFYRVNGHVIKTRDRATTVNGALWIERGSIAIPVTWLRTDNIAIAGSYPGSLAV